MGAEARWRLVSEPRPWQTEAFEIWRHHRKGVAAVVTGGGKTVFALLCMAHYHERVPDGSIIIVVPTLALADQWYVACIDLLGLSDGDIGVYSGESRPESPRAINIMVVNTARRAAPQVGRADSFLIVDECHRVGSRENAKALRGEFGWALGLSATPEREYDSGFAEFVEPSLGPVMFRYDYDRAAREGVISPFELINVRVDLTAAESEVYGRLSARIARLRPGPPDELGDIVPLLRQRATIAATAAMRTPCAVRLVLQHPTERSIVFHERISAAARISEILNQRGVSSTLYHSQLPGPVRRDNLRLFRHGTFRNLTTCRALDEGIDVPEASVAVVASSTASTRQRIQRLGRVLRTSPQKPLATIYTIYATELEEQRLMRETQSLKEARAIVWRKAEVK